MATTTKQDRKTDAIDWRRDKVLELTARIQSKGDSKITASWKWNYC